MQAKKIPERPSWAGRVSALAVTWERDGDSPEKSIRVSYRCNQSGTDCRTAYLLTPDNRVVLSKAYSLNIHRRGKPSYSLAEIEAKIAANCKSQIEKTSGRAAAGSLPDADLFDGSLYLDANSVNNALGQPSAVPGVEMGALDLMAEELLTLDERMDARKQLRQELRRLRTKHNFKGGGTRSQDAETPASQTSVPQADGSLRGGIAGRWGGRDGGEDLGIEQPAAAG